MISEFDVIIIGGGPGGYAAALYAARANLTTLVLEKFSPGGQMATTDIVENYPGFAEGINGFELGMQMKKGAERFGVKTKLLLCWNNQIFQKTPPRFSAAVSSVLTSATHSDLSFSADVLRRGFVLSPLYQ